MDETQKKLDAIKAKQDACDHLGEYLPVAQQTFEDKMKQRMVLITTIMCKNCGNLFFDTQDTDIRPRVTVVPGVGSEKESDQGGENGSKN